MEEARDAHGIVKVCEEGLKGPRCVLGRVGRAALRPKPLPLSLKPSCAPSRACPEICVGWGRCCRPCSYPLPFPPQLSSPFFTPSIFSLRSPTLARQRLLRLLVDLVPLLGAVRQPGSR